MDRNNNKTTSNWRSVYEKTFPGLHTCIKTRNNNDNSTDESPRFVLLALTEPTIPSSQRRYPLQSSVSIFVSALQWSHIRQALAITDTITNTPYISKQFGANKELLIIRAPIPTANGLLWATSLFIAKKVYEDRTAASFEAGKPPQFNCSGVTLDSTTITELLRDHQLTLLADAHPTNV